MAFWYDKYYNVYTNHVARRYEPAPRFLPLSIDSRGGGAEDRPIAFRSLRLSTCKSHGIASRISATRPNIVYLDDLSIGCLSSPDTNCTVTLAGKCDRQTWRNPYIQYTGFRGEKSSIMIRLLILELFFRWILIQLLKNDCWIFFFLFFFVEFWPFFFFEIWSYSIWSPEEFRRSSISLNLIEWSESCWMFYFGVEL